MKCSKKTVTTNVIVILQWDVIRLGEWAKNCKWSLVLGCVRSYSSVRKIKRQIIIEQQRVPDVAAHESPNAGK